MIETGSVLLKACILPIVKAYISDVGLESEILEAASTTAIGEAITKVGKKINNAIYSNPTNAEKLTKILNDEFEKQNHLYNDLFTDALEKLKIIDKQFDSEEEMKAWLITWNTERPNIVRSLSIYEISNFVRDFFNGVRNKINSDDDLNQFISIMNIKNIVTEIKDEQYTIINMLEKIINKIETSEKTTYSNNTNMIENTGDYSEFENIKQTGNNSNTIINSGNGSVFKGIIQG